MDKNGVQYRRRLMARLDRFMERIDSGCFDHCVKALNVNAWYLIGQRAIDGDSRCYRLFLDGKSQIPRIVIAWFWLSMDLSL